jgi:hypothetical protein
VTAYPDTDIAAMSFYFWHRLSHVLVGGRSSRKIVEVHSLEEEEAERARRHQIFRPAYVHLIQNIMGGNVNFGDDLQPSPNYASSSELGGNVFDENWGNFL